MAKEINLSQGKVAIVDDDDFDWLNRWKWCAQKSGRNYYAMRNTWNPGIGKFKAIIMHRLIMNAPSITNSKEDIQVDHINGDGLDNRRENLRLVNRVQQCMNRPLRADNKSGHKGVYWFKYPRPTQDGRTGCWRALIKVDGKRVSLGLFDNVREAAKAYEEAAEKYYGEYKRR